MPPPREIRSTARRAAQTLLQSGPRLLARKVLAELFHRRLVIYEARLDVPRASIRSDLPLGFDRLDVDRVHDYLDCVPDADPEQLRARMSVGDRCGAARLHDRVVAVQWAAFRTCRSRTCA